VPRAAAVACAMLDGGMEKAIGMHGVRIAGAALVALLPAVYLALVWRLVVG